MKTTLERSATGVRVRAWAMLAALLSSFNCGASVFYQFDVVAQTDGTTLYHIGKEVSVNDKGRAAFVGYTTASTTSFNSIWIGDGHSVPPRPVNPSWNFALRDFKFPQINDHNSIVAYDRLSGTPATYYLRTWNSDAMAPTPKIIDFVDNDGSLTFPSISNDEFVAYLQHLITPGLLQDQVKVWTGLNTNTILVRPFATLHQPMVGAGGFVVLKKGAAAIDPIVLINQAGASEVIADNGLFDDLGRSPGISDDGEIIAFYGDGNALSAHPGLGIFVSVKDETGTRQIVRVAGNTAELGYSDAGGPLRLNNFDKDSRIGVCHQKFGTRGVDKYARESFVVCFKGIPDAKSITNPQTGKPLLFSDQEGIWAVRVDVEPDLAPPGTHLNFNPTSPLPVVQVGDQLQGAQITDLFIHDPVANAAETDGAVRDQRLGDHYVAFWAKTSAGEFAVRAAHLDSDGDGLLDHWETDGIDIDQDGVIDLNLPAIGADVSKRDLFVEIDWLAGQPYHFHWPDATAIDKMIAVFNEAPKLSGPVFGFRSDGNSPADIPKGITVHVDAGPDIYRNMPNIPGAIDGGDEIGMPGAPLDHIDIVYYGIPGSFPNVSTLTTRSFHEIKDQNFGGQDKRARELAFHYVVMADSCDLADRRVPQLQVADRGNNWVTTASSLAPGKLVGQLIEITSGSARGQWSSIAANDAHRITVKRNWQPLPSIRDSFALIDDASGNSETFVQPSDFNSQPGNDVLITLLSFGRGATGTLGDPRAQWRTLVHELGHNLGLRHCGTSPDEFQCWCGDRGQKLFNCEALAKSHLSLMSYAHQVTPSQTYKDWGNMPEVESYAFSSDPTFDDWSNLKMDFQNNFAFLGNSFGKARGNVPAPPSEDGPVISPEMVDVERPTVKIVSPISGSLVPFGGALPVTLIVRDNIEVAFVQVAFDLNGNGIATDPGESVTATPAGPGTFTATLSNPSGAPGIRILSVTALDTSMNSATATSVVAVASAACGYSIVPAGQSLAAQGGSGAFSLTTSGGCPWAAQPDSEWISVTSSNSGAGSTLVQFSVSSNKWAVARSGAIVVAGRIFAVDQAAGPCGYVLAPGSQSFGENDGFGMVGVSAPAGCSWSAATTVPWISITSSNSGSGKGTIDYAVGSNPSFLSRSGTIVIEDQTFLVNQAGIPSEFRITDIRLLTNGTVQLSFPAKDASYYVLYRATNLAELVAANFPQTSAAIDLHLGTNGIGLLYDAIPASRTEAAFYRVAEVSTSQPQDSDHDGIEDVYELQHFGILNPLNPTDAARDFDGDGLSNLNEYLDGSNPADPPTSVVSVLENDRGFTSVRVLVGLTNGGVQTNVVAFATVDGTARFADNDYMATNGTITFLPGEIQKGIVILVRGDTQVESNESFYINLSLSSAQPGVALVFTQIACTILNDDAPLGVTSGLVSLETTAYAKLATVPSCDFACWTVQDTNAESLVFTNGLVGPEDRARADARARRVNPYASSSAEASPGRLSVQTWVNVPFPQTDGTGWYVVTNSASYSVPMKPVTAAIPLGTNCTLSVRLHIFGQMSWFLSNIQGTGAVLSARCQFAVNGGVLDSRFYQDRRLLDGNTNLSIFPGTNGDTIEIRIPVKNGQMFTNRVILESRLIATVRDIFGVGNNFGTGPGGFLGMADFSPGVYWGGAVLYDAQDQIIPDFTIESPTLIDWRRSLVPTNPPGPRPVQLGSYNPLKPNSLAIQPPALVLTNPLQNAALQVTASYTNGTVSNVTSAAAWTLYKSYDTRVATVDRNGIVTARGNGKTVVRAENQGATRCILVTVSMNTPILTVTGIVQRRNGQPAAGASVKIAETTQESIADSNGQFTIMGVPGASNTVTAMAVWQTNGIRESATSLTFSNLSSGTTSVGVIVLNTFFDLRAARMLMADLDDDRAFSIGGSPVVLPDGLPSGWELLFGYDPTRWDTDGNGIMDPNEDPDGDGVVNGAAGPIPNRRMLSEEENGTDPFSYDSDGDVWDDQIEIQLGSNPHLPNSIPGQFIAASPPVRGLVTGIPDGNTVPPSPSEMFVVARPHVSAMVTGIPSGSESPPPIAEQFILAQPPVTVRTNSP